MLNLLSIEIPNKTALLILMIVLLVFLVLMTVLGIVFIVALRKRAPVIKVVMAPPKDEEEDEEEVAATQTVEEEQPVEEQPVIEETPAEPEPVKEEQPVVVEEPAPEPAPVVSDKEEEIADDDDDDSPIIVTEGKESVRYVKSFNAKIIQLNDESKEWYSAIKNELLSYKKVKSRLSWKRETFRIGRMNIARLIVRGKTLCLLLAIEASGLQGTKFAVEDVSSVASTSDTPCQYRIKSARRAKYAKELISAVMKELNTQKDVNFVAQDYYLPYEGNVALMEKGLIKRVTSESTRTFEIREVVGKAQEESAVAATVADGSADDK